ncbi:MAG TPA: DUF3857 domain-containing protein [Salinivirgaceae bacterium]|mgnify:CR=1 FL=1|nr:DUF3857 domain-containing protein [Salinivirgaceae bacterium]
MKLSKINLYVAVFGLFCYAFLTDTYGKNFEPDARYLKMVKTYRFNPDGSYVYDYEHYLLYNSYFSFHRLYGETFIVYNPSFQRLEIMTAETRMADGTLVKAPQNAFNEVLPSWAAHSGAYNHLKEMVVTHTGLECGAVAHLHYSIFSSPEPQGFRHFVEPLVREVPIDTLIITIVVPEGFPFRFAENLPMKPKRVEEGENTKYIFQITGINAKEPFGLSAECDEPRVIFQIGEKSLEQLLKDFGEENSPLQSISDAQWDLALDIRSNIASVNTIAVPPTFHIFPIQNPVETLKRNSGTSLEKAVLLAKQLREAGISSKLLLKFPDNTIDPSISNFASLLDVYVAIQRGDMPVVLSTETRQTIGLSKQSGFVFVYLESDGLRKLWEKASLSVDSRVEFTLDSKGKCSGTETVLFHSGAPIFLSKTGNSVSAGELTGRNGDVISYESTPEGKLSYTVQQKEVKVDMVDNVVTIAVPTVKYGFDVKHFSPLPDSFSNQICIDAPVKEQTVVELMLPKEAKLFSDVVNQRYSGNFGTVEVSMKSKGSKVIFLRKIEITQSNIAPSDYPEFKRAMDFIGSQKANAIYVQLP